MVNVNNIQAIINFIKNEDTSLNMQHYFNGKNLNFGEVTCRSPMCIAGTAYYLSGQTLNKDDVIDSSKEFMGIDDDQWFLLCSPWTELKYPSYEKFSSLKKIVAGRKVKVFSKEGVIHTLEYLRDTGQVCWFVNVNGLVV